MKFSSLTLATALTVGAAIANPSAVNAQFVFGQVGSTSVEAAPLSAFFIPTTSSANTPNFGPPVGFYHYFFLPQYTSAYSRLYSDFEYDLPEDSKIGYEFTIIRSFKY